VQRKMEALLLKARGLPHHQIATCVGVCENEELTGLKRSPTQGRIFLKKLGLKRLKTAAVPAKLDADLQETFKTTSWSRG
jgi:hypothetical protein